MRFMQRDRGVGVGKGWYQNTGKDPRSIEGAGMHDNATADNTTCQVFGRFCLSTWHSNDVYLKARINHILIHAW